MNYLKTLILPNITDNSVKKGLVFDIETMTECMFYQSTTNVIEIVYFSFAPFQP